MSEYQAYAPVHTRIVQFQTEMNKLFKEAVEERTNEIKIQNLQEVTDRLYGPATPLAKFEKMKVSQSNAPTFTAIYKLLEAYSKVAPGDTGKIESLGKEAGFTKEESVCLYNMAKYAKAMDNIRSQYNETVRFVVGNA